MAAAPKKDRGPGAVDLIEEAVHLVRANPRPLALYYATSGPFAFGFVYFIGALTWFAPTDGEIAAGALALTLLFAVMKSGHRRFALELHAIRAGEARPVFRWKDWVAAMNAEVRIHATAPVVLPLAILFAVPLPWAYGYYQSATAMPLGLEGGERRRESWRQAALWPRQNCVLLSIFGALWVVVFLNLGAAFYSIPNAATEWLGLDTVFAISGWQVLNTTFLALIGVLTHLAVDPLAKACYVLRVFHGRARETGADIRLVLARERSPRSASNRAAAVLLLLALLFAHPPRSRAAESTPPPAVSTQKLDRALDEVFEQPDFRWRLRPLPAERREEDKGIIRGFFAATAQTIAEMARATKRLFGSVRDWFSDLFPSRKDELKTKDDPAARGSLDWMAALQMISIVLLAAVVGLLLFVAWRIWRRNREIGPLRSGAVPVIAAAPDLRDDSVQASQLPADGWLELARSKMADAEWRLALRALFLATLAGHAHHGLISLAKSKTNFDYETELRRRARERTNLVQEFRQRRRQYEDVWYGALPATDHEVRAWLERLEAKP